MRSTNYLCCNVSNVVMYRVSFFPYTWCQISHEVQFIFPWYHFTKTFIKIYLQFSSLCCWAGYVCRNRHNITFLMLAYRGTLAVSHYGAGSYPV